VLIGACVPEVKVLGVFKLPGLTLLAMYLLGTIAALIMAWVFKSTFLKSPPPLLIMELPPYKRPLATVVLRHMWDRSKVFLTQAGTVILGINIILWFLASYPKQPSIQAEFDARRAEIVRQAFPGTDSSEAIQARLAQLRKGGPDSVGAPDFKTFREQLGMLEREEASARLQHSFAGLLGRIIEPVIEPLGFDWKIGIGIISSFAAREVFVSTMSVVYNVGEESGNGASASLVKVMKEQRRPDGRAVFTPRTTFSLMIFYVFALQCASTVAVVRRETNSWKWPIFQWLYLGILAWVMAFLTYHGGQLLGFH
jgi:ferrous iron transport protein B